jgi:peptidoglycan-N-acetylglucosamine deacetylase
MCASETPGSSSLDDAAYFRFARDREWSLASPQALSDVLTDEYQSAVDERRMTTWTFHPSIIGRPHRLAVLRRVLEEILSSGKAWFARHADVLDHVRRPEMDR